MTTPQLSWDDAVFFSDVDDTLIPTAASTPLSSQAIQEVFAARFTEEIGKRVKKEFENIFNVMFSGHIGKPTDDYQLLVSQILSYQKDIIAKFGKAKLWSREIFVLISAQRAKIETAPELLYEAADAYWLRLSEVADPFPGVTNFSKEIKRHQRPLYLLTSSDGRLKEGLDGQFLYDPSYSEAFKRERMQLLREKEIDFNLVSIGDPEDKPGVDFFEKGIHMAEKDLEEKIDLSKAIMVGDSFKGDLQTPKEQLGFGLVVLFEHGRTKTEIVDDHYVKVGNLQEIEYFLQ